MKLTFSKYQGTGNDFIMVLAPNNPQFNPDVQQIRAICNRRFGIGADGLIIIKNHDTLDFEVDYYNADGSQSFCGNGARCSVQFAKDQKIIQTSCKFMAIDGEHEATIEINGDVKLRMNKVNRIEKVDSESSTYILDTGSPHYVKFCADENIDIVSFGREVRYSERFKIEGINVNTAYPNPDFIYVETYERGVEDETYSCGTGVTAVALAAAQNQIENHGITPIKTKGGRLQIHWKKNPDGSFDDIYLEGPALHVYDGQIAI